MNKYYEYMAERETEINLVCEKFQKVSNKKQVEIEKSKPRKLNSIRENLAIVTMTFVQKVVVPTLEFLLLLTLFQFCLQFILPACFIIILHPVMVEVQPHPTPQHINPIKLLPTIAEVRPFSETYSNYFARECVAQCEDIMVNSYVTDNVDQIYFLQSHLVWMTSCTPYVFKCLH